MQLYIPIEEERGEGGIVSNNVLYYQSEKFELDGSQKPQFFPLDNVLFMGGEIRFVFSNFLQRQTLEEIVGENYDDYYMCIAHASVHCTFVNDFHVASVWKTERNPYSSSGKQHTFGATVTETSREEVICFVVAANEEDLHDFEGDSDDDDDDEKEGGQKVPWVDSLGESAASANRSKKARSKREMMKAECSQYGRRWVPWSIDVSTGNLDI